MKDWFVYIVECRDGTLYTGITDNVETRIKAHNAGKGAKYTRGRGPVKLVYSENNATKGEALKRELDIKRMSREAKKKLGLR